MRRLLIVSSLLLLAACSAETGLETVNPRHGEIREFFDEPARTRLAREYPIAMPLDGRIGRIELEPGAEVRQGQLLAVFDRLPLEEVAREAREVVAELERQLELNAYDEIEHSMQVELQTIVEAAGKVLQVES